MKKKTFPKVRFIFDIVLALIFGRIVPLVAETFVQNNVQSPAYLDKLKEGINSSATLEGLSRLPYIVSVVSILISLLFIIKAIILIVNHFKD